MDKLAIFGGEKAIKIDSNNIFAWPIVTDEHKAAVWDVLVNCKMSRWDITSEFEKKFAIDFQRKYALACNNGTAAIHCGFWGMGIGKGDEVICPSITYWASILQVFSLGATPVFADIDPQTLCIDPYDIENCITPRTKAIVVVHYAGMPADMDRIMQITQKYNLKVIEDCSHAHASLYKGRQVGTFGDAAGFSLMTGKSFAIGEGGILTTDNEEIYERAILFGFYERHNEIKNEKLKKYKGIPAGGYKYRMHQASSAFGLVQLKHYKQQFAEIDKAMNYFCDQIDNIQGLKSHRPHRNGNTTKGGWYYPLAFYDSKQLSGLSVGRFVEALQAEGINLSAGCNRPLHLHSTFEDFDIYNSRKPTRTINLPSNIDAKHLNRKLPISESINGKIIQLPWFKYFRKEVIDQYVSAFKKVSSQYELLLKDDKKEAEFGGYSSTWKR